MQKARAFEVLSKEQTAQIQRAVVAVQPVLILEETPSPKESPKDLAQADKSVPTDPLLIKEPKEPKI
jgi:hypothetical protein